MGVTTRRASTDEQRPSAAKITKQRRVTFEAVFCRRIVFLNLLDAFNSGKPIVDQAVKLPIHTGFVAVIADAKCTQSVDVLLQSVLIRRCLLFDT
jgi:hypothetical protein|tara:strand:- start:68 stop:352 length:285 start_codon:yes stop_codon:yes gene_type:complete